MRFGRRVSSHLDALIAAHSLRSVSSKLATSLRRRAESVQKPARATKRHSRVSRQAFCSNLAVTELFSEHRATALQLVRTQATCFTQSAWPPMICKTWHFLSATNYSAMPLRDYSLSHLPQRGALTCRHRRTLRICVYKFCALLWHAHRCADVPRPACSLHFSGNSPEAASTTHQTASATPTGLP